MFYSSTEDILTLKQYGFCPTSTTTDCLLDLIEETTTTIDKGDTDKKLIAFVASVMLIALLKQIKSGVPAGLLSSQSGSKRVEELKKQLAFIYASVWMYETFNCTALLYSGKAKTCFHKCLGFANQAVHDTSGNHR